MVKETNFSSLRNIHSSRDLSANLGLVRDAIMEGEYDPPVGESQTDVFGMTSAIFPVCFFCFVFVFVFRFYFGV